MGLIAVYSSAEYENSIRQLFPTGEFWDAQFADQNSDLSIFCKAQAEEIYRFKQIRANLLEEAFPSQAVQTLGDWERVFGINNSNLSVAERQAFLRVVPAGVVNIKILNSIASIYGATLLKINFIKPAFFGRSYFGSRMAGPAYFSVLFLFIVFSNESLKASLESALNRVLLANQTIHYIYRSHI